MKDVGKKWLTDQRGAVNPLLVSTIILALLLVTATGGFVWAYSRMTYWQNDTEGKLADARTAAKVEQQADDDKKYREEEKKPNRVYQGPTDLGSVKFNYPKTWSVYEAETENKLQAYFYPIKVPKVAAGVTPYALRVNVDDTSYADTLKQYESIVKDGKATATAIQLKNGDDQYDGTRVDGQITKTVNGSVVIFKVRDKTLQLFVDSGDYKADFDNIILKSLTFKQ